MMDFEKQMREWDAKTVELFKQSIVERANQTLEAWKNGVNEFYRRHVDLALVDDYVERFGADREELENLIHEAYSLDRI